MKRTRISLTASFLASLCAAPLVAHAGTANINVDASQVGAGISPGFYGAFFEEINHAGNGGLYAELIQHRGFEDADISPGFTLKDGFIVPPRADPFREGRPVDWKLKWNVTSFYPAWPLATTGGSEATIAVDTKYPLDAAAPHSLKISTAKASANGNVRLVNDGYWGIGVKQGAIYDLNFHAHRYEFHEPKRCYDVKVQSDGDKVRAYLDGKLIQEVTLPQSATALSIAGRDGRHHRQSGRHQLGTGADDL